jgi:acetyl-CoA acetyltransferase family protein
VLLGNVLNGRGNLARYAALGTALPVEVPGCTIDRQCASGMEAVAQAFFRIRAAASSGTLVCGGVESMSQAPFLMSRAVRAFDRSPPAFLNVPLAPPEAGDPSMIETAEWVSAQFKISRESMDQYAVRSHQRAITAQADGLFDSEVVPVDAPDETGRTVRVAHDQGPRADTSAARLAALRPVLPGGCVTAGNASGISDGAAVVVVMGEQALRRSGARPLARVIDVACVGVAPMQMGLGPVPATHRLLERNGIGSDRIDAWELNEAFAGQVLAVASGLGLDPETINREGGAIALGHPLGASGARIVGHLAHRLAALPAGRLGVAALCVGGGMGMAMLLEGAS